ncbi:hypothetical protein HMPREF0262_02044 [Clostridium sp. ATCC 29733]|nr:hypothetical protein HMPREF0262_02044 [Clostridium sp. ATCC 29733]
MRDRPAARTIFTVPNYTTAPPGGTIPRPREASAAPTKKEEHCSSFFTSGP